MRRAATILALAGGLARQGDVAGEWRARADALGLGDGAVSAGQPAWLVISPGMTGTSVH